MASNTIDIIESGLSTAPSPASLRPDLLGRAAAPCGVPFASGENRLAFGGFGDIAVNGITATGRETHAAVRMHVIPATGAAWSYGKCQKDSKAPAMNLAPTSSAGRLRRS